MDALWLHCNVCQASPNEMELYLTQCGHIVCSDHSRTVQCGICRSSTTYLSLKKRMPPHIRPFFESLDEIVEKTKTVVQFQSGHSKSMIQALQVSISHLKTERAQLKDENLLLKKQLSQMQMREKELRAQAEQYRRGSGHYVDSNRPTSTSALAYSTPRIPPRRSPSLVRTKQSTSTIGGHFTPKMQTNEQHSTQRLFTQQLKQSHGSMRSFASPSPSPIQSVRNTAHVHMPSSPRTPPDVVMGAKNSQQDSNSSFRGYGRLTNIGLSPIINQSPQLTGNRDRFSRLPATPGY